MATMKDVANRAGVSVATVSCHLSGAKPVKPETRMKIAQAIKELKYVPNAAARQLKKADMKAVGVVLPDFKDRLYSELFRGAVEFFQSRNINVHLTFSFGNARIERQAIYNFTHQNVSGLIIVSCQPENSGFFADWQESYRIPAVYCLHKITGASGGFAGFNSYQTSRFMASSLLKQGLSRQVIVTGDRRFSCEADFLRGVEDAYQTEGEPLDEKNVFITNMTKENAFKVAMETASRPLWPDAVLCSSGQIAKGVVEAFTAMKIRIPDDVAVITLGEDSWNKSEHLPNVVYTMRDAARLGNASSKLLYEGILSPGADIGREICLQDRFLSKPIKLIKREVSAAPNTLQTVGEITVLTFLGILSGCMPAFENAASIFTAETGIRVNFAHQEYNDVQDVTMFMRIGNETKYDAVVFDMPWKEDFILQKCIDNLSDIIEREDFPADKILACDFKNYFSRGRCYGLPIINGAQTLFYRRDLFEDPEIIAAYYEQCHAVLKPPRTWSEYCRIARFFTREFNPDSPTDWGVSEMDYDDGSLIAQNISRFISAGGNLWDENGRLDMDTPRIRRAIEIMCEPYKYTKNNTFNPQSCTAIESFCMGEAAMCITFNDGATSLRDAISKRLIGLLGYARPPEGHSIRAGWGLGIHPDSKKREEIYRFYKWFTRTDISYYYTILSGNTSCKLPYENGEVLDLYPWMALFPHGETNYCKRLSVPPSPGGAYISNIVLEKVFSNMIRKLVIGDGSVSEVLKWAQSEILNGAAVWEARKQTVARGE